MNVTFGADAVQVDACTDIVHLDVLFEDGTRDTLEFSSRKFALPQSRDNAIISLSLEDEGGLDLQYDAPANQMDLIPVEEEEPEDNDDDGVPAANDCDDGNPMVGALLYENDFSDDDGYLALGPKLTDPWWFDGEAHNTDGGQQALIGQAEGWGNTVTYGSLRVSDVQLACGNNCVEDNTRYRAGFLARTTIDADQDEGYHGYRCAVARNSGADCYDPGRFVQLAAFLDGPEDDINSECDFGCPPNPTFDQLDRENRTDQTDLLAGDGAKLTFWAVGNKLVCEFDGSGGDHVVAKAIDDRFASGTTGLSTLNALTDFDHVRVCEAFGTP